MGLRLLSARLRAGAERLGARRLVGLPARGTASGGPGCLLVSDPTAGVLFWDDQQAGVVDLAQGRVAGRLRLPAAVAGLGDDGLPRVAAGDRWLRLETAPLALTDAGDRGPEPTLCASDSPEAPETEPFVVTGGRRYRARLSVTARVTRHMLEICDEGHPPREQEIAAYTLRSDRLRLSLHGGGVVSGAVGGDPLAPTASIAGRRRGPVLVARRRFDSWHEHVAGQTTDLVGHGPATLELIVFPDGAAPAWSVDAGPVDESWDGLDRRSATPPAMVRGLGVIALGLAGDGDEAVVELVDLAAARGTPARLVARRRAIATLPLSRTASGGHGVPDPPGRA